MTLRGQNEEDSDDCSRRVRYRFSCDIGRWSARRRKNSPRKGAPNLGQESATALAQRPLVLSGSVPVEGVKRRFDHFASGKGRVFISALGNNTVEVINLFGGIVEHTITGVTNPQGVAFSPDANKLFVASAQGKLYIYDGDAFDLIPNIDSEGGADNLRYDACDEASLRWLRR
jgi:hypothetical protein